MTASIDDPSNGTYSEIESAITMNNCNDLTLIWDFNFEINGNTLIINYPCFEPCRAKYKKQ